MTQSRDGQRVFISYSLHDKEWVRAFAQDIQDQGFDVWLEDWTATSAGVVSKALRDSDVVILLVTDQYLDSPWTLFELGAAMAGNKAVVPVVSEGIDLSKLPVPLRHVVFVRKEEPKVTAERVVSGLLKAS